jgi:hypothetical protein
MAATAVRIKVPSPRNIARFSLPLIPANGCIAGVLSAITTETRYNHFQLKRNNGDTAHPVFGHLAELFGNGRSISVVVFYHCLEGGITLHMKRSRAV